MDKMKKIILVLLSLIFLVNLVSAIDWNMPSNVNVNSNFDIAFSGSGFYCIEANIPNSFVIVSDVTGGTFNNGIYKTCYASNFKITLRPTKAGEYIFNGEFTEGSGIKDLDSVTIKVNEIQIAPSCPVCPSATAWSNCEDNKQIKIFYECSASTNYQCSKSTIIQSCNIEVSQGEDAISNQSTICDVGWLCKDENNVAYQSSDCSLSSIQSCSEGCENNECKVREEIKQQFPELGIDILPEGKQEIEIKQENPNKKSFFDKIIEFFKKIIDVLIFWD